MTRYADEQILQVASMVKDTFAQSMDTLKVIFLNTGFTDEDHFVAGMVYFKLLTRLNHRGKLNNSNVLGNDTRIISNKSDNMPEFGDLWNDPTLTNREPKEKRIVESPESHINFFPAKETLKSDTAHLNGTTSERHPVLAMSSVEFVQQDLARELVDRQVRFRKLFNKVKAGTTKQDLNNKKLGHYRKTEIQFLIDAKERLEKKFSRFKNKTVESMRQLM